jgi:predicted transcriptional regulator
MIDTHVMIPAALHERLRQYAFAARRGQGEVIREALIFFLDRQDRKSKKDRD